MRRAREAIVTREPLGPSEKADLLAVLWFIAEAEDVPTRAMRAYLTEEQLMGSELYESILARGEARGRVLGVTENRAETVVRLLTYRMGAIPASVREHVSTMTDAATLSAWYDEALLMIDAEAARRLVEKIDAARGATAVSVETVIRLLTYRMGAIPASVRERVSTMTDSATLSAWYDESLLMLDAEAARRLVEKIEKAPIG